MSAAALAAGLSAEGVTAPTTGDRPPMAIRPLRKATTGGVSSAVGENSSALSTDAPAEVAETARSWLFPFLVVGGTIALVAVVCVGLWFALRAGRPVAESGPRAPATQGALPSSPKASEEPSLPLPTRPWWWEWIPGQTTVLVYGDFRRVPRDVLTGAGGLLLGEAADRELRGGLEALGLRPEALAELVWLRGPGTKRPPRLLAVRLLPQHSTQGLSLRGEASNFALRQLAFRTSPGVPWPELFAAIDTQTAVAGDRQLLEDLASSPTSPPPFASDVVTKLWKQLPADAPLVAIVDLETLRAAGWEPPVWLSDVWPEVAPAWQAVCRMPVGLIVFYRDSPQPLLQVGLLCPSPTAASQLGEALGPLATFGENLKKQLAEGGLPPELATVAPGPPDQTRAALWSALVVMLAGFRWEVVDDFVWIRVGLGPPPAETQGATFRDWYDAVEGQWLAAGLRIDFGRHEAIQKSLTEFRQTAGHFPPGAGGAALLPPETRLSWIALLLPQLGLADWHKELNFGYSWNSATNRPVAQRELSAVINPTLGPKRVADGFPVTHYVGVGGVGPDAPMLPASDPRAGVFGYRRTIRLEDIPDGASQTAAIFGVYDRLGPWAAGGPATVRPLTQPPYVNGPDGFGSGQPHGMLVGMADGSVRFLSAEIDPVVLEQLAAIGDGAPRSVDSLLASARAADTPSADSNKPQPAATNSSSPTANLRPPQPAKEPRAGPESSPAPAEAPAASPASNPAELVALRLSSPLEEIRTSDIPLADAARALGQLANVPVSFDLEALATLGLSPLAPIRAEIRPGNFEKAFSSLAQQAGLVALIDGGHVVFTTPPETRDTLVAKSYDVRDLISGTTATASGRAGQGQLPNETQELAKVLRELVWPETWKENGGRGTIAIDGDNLRIEQTELVHQAVVKFLEKLRLARQKKGSGPLKTRKATAGPFLARRVTVNFFEPVPFSRIIRQLERQTDVRIFVNWRSLAENGLWPEPTTTFCAENQPLAQALEQLLLPLGLGYRVVEPQVLEVSTLKAIGSAMEVEFYPVADLIALLQKDEGLEGAAHEVLVETLSAQVASDTWSDAGGPAKMWFDRQSEHLVVLQSQPVHRELEELLGRLRKEWASGGSLPP